MGISRSNGSDGQSPERLPEKKPRIAGLSGDITDFWQYIAQLQLPDNKHVLYLSCFTRDNRTYPYGKFEAYFPARDGSLVPIADKEALELAIHGQFGGGQWRLILKKGMERVCETMIYTGDGPTRMLPAPVEANEAFAGMPGAYNSFTQYPNASAPSAAAAIAGPEQQVNNIGLSLFTTAAGALERLAYRGNTDPAVSGLLAEIQRLNDNVVRSNQNPLQQFSEFAQLMREMNGGSGGDITRQMEQFKSFLELAREMYRNNPIPAASSGEAGLWPSVVNVLPQAIDAARAGFSDWRAAKESEERAVAMMIQQPQQRPAAVARPGTVPFPQPPPAQVTAPPAPAAAPAAPPPPPNSGNGAPSTQFVEARIVELVQAPLSPEEAASRVLEFLHTLSGANTPPEASYVTQLAKLGETGLLNLFHLSPVLKAATGSPEKTQRLVNFIRAFLKYHAQDMAEESSQPQPN